MVVTSAYFRGFTKVFPEVQSLVERENTSGERTHPWVLPVAIVRMPGVMLPSLSAGTGRGGHCELEELVVEEFRSDGVEWRAEVHNQDPPISPRGLWVT